LSFGHCGNGCRLGSDADYLPNPISGEEWLTCREVGCWCWYVGSCRPWWRPKWLGAWWMLRRRL
jgi:hypothetical protein